MRKNEWVEIVKQVTGEKHHDRTIAYHIEMAINTVIGQIFRSDPSQVDLFAREFTATIVAGTRPYALLPARIMQTPDISSGVRRIKPVGSDMIMFVPMPSFGHSLFTEVGLDDVDDSCGYEVRSDRVLFWNLRYPVENILMDLVVPFMDWEDTWDFPVPLGTADQITQLAASTFKGQQAETNIYKKK